MTLAAGGNVKISVSRRKGENIIGATVRGAFVGEKKRPYRGHAALLAEISQANFLCLSHESYLSTDDLILA